MTTAIAPTIDQRPASKTPAQAAYSGERRSTAAKWGWATRRWIPGPPDPETLARERLEALLAQADPTMARLHACEAAATVVHHFTERYPGDEGCTKVIAAARRFAQGSMSEWGRKRASTAARKLVTRAGEDAGSFNRPFHSAANAAGWCLDHDVRRGVYWAIIWAAGCAGYDQRVATLERHADILAARLR